MTHLTNNNLHIYDYLLDASNLRCPMPILETKKVLKKLPDKSIILIKTSEASFKLDIAVYTKKTGHKLIKVWTEELFYYALVQKIEDTQST